jgi:hypothetical protein
LPKGGDVSQVQTEVSWEEVSPWPIITFWDLLQSIFQVDSYKNQFYNLSELPDYTKKSLVKINYQIYLNNSINY